MRNKIFGSKGLIPSRNLQTMIFNWNVSLESSYNEGFEPVIWANWYLWYLKFQRDSPELFILLMVPATSRFLSDRSGMKFYYWSSSTDLPRQVVVHVACHHSTPVLISIYLSPPLWTVWGTGLATLSGVMCIKTVKQMSFETDNVFDAMHAPWNAALIHEVSNEAE